MKALVKQPRVYDGHTRAREKALADGLKDVAAELRLVDVVDLITFIRTENHPNIGDLVNSSVELFFKEDTLRYGWAAEVDLKWGSTPSIMLDMEFRHLRVTVFFKLILESLHAAVDLHYVSFESPSPNPGDNTSHLIRAIADAKLPARAARAESAHRG
jgi:hypothetical protein